MQYKDLTIVVLILCAGIGVYVGKIAYKTYKDAYQQVSPALSAKYSAL